MVQSAYTNASDGVRYTQYDDMMQAISVVQSAYTNASYGLRHTQDDAMLQVISVVQYAYTNASYGVRHSQKIMRYHPGHKGASLLTRCLRYVCI